MYVQDIKLSGTNITAEISKDEVSTFKKLCQLFTLDSSFGHFIGEYASTQTAGNANGYNKTSNCAQNPKTNSKSSLISMESLKIAIKYAEVEAKVASSKPCSSKNLENVIDVKNVSMLAKTEMLNLLSRSKTRKKNEVQIIKTLSNYAKTIHPALAVVPYGSSVYGFGGLKTNFNILIEMGNICDICLNAFLSILNFDAFDRIFGTST